MPKKTMDYSKCVMYKIVCNDLSVTDCYVGHTTNFKQRKNCHRIACNYKGRRSYNYKIYQTMRDNGGRDNWDIIEIEKYPCKDFYEACTRERYWYETLKPNLNMSCPIIYKEEKLQKKKEYYEANKEEILQKQKENYEANKEEILQKQKENYKKNSLKEPRPIGINLEKKKETKIKWYDLHKEELNKSFECECGGLYKLHHKTDHIKTKKHQEHLSSQKIN
jgi:hypothetical protein